MYQVKNSTALKHKVFFLVTVSRQGSRAATDHPIGTSSLCHQKKESTSICLSISSAHMCSSLSIITSLRNALLLILRGSSRTLNSGALSLGNLLV
uniref:Uncharacterized protein n=1 Tax=Arundo donax TaxID=35708 RepID=A0A0A8ZTV1_ARUDO